MECVNEKTGLMITPTTPADKKTFLIQVQDSDLDFYLTLPVSKNQLNPYTHLGGQMITSDHISVRKRIVVVFLGAFSGEFLALDTLFGHKSFF